MQKKYLPSRTPETAFPRNKSLAVDGGSCWGRGKVVFHPLKERRFFYLTPYAERLALLIEPCLVTCYTSAVTSIFKIVDPWG